jgi:hypothetical protein
MHGWLLQTPLRERTLRQWCTLSLDRIDKPVAEMPGLHRVLVIDSLHRTDPPR